MCRPLEARFLQLKFNALEAQVYSTFLPFFTDDSNRHILCQKSSHCDECVRRVQASQWLFEMIKSKPVVIKCSVVIDNWAVHDHSETYIMSNST